MRLIKKSLPWLAMIFLLLFAGVLIYSVLIEPQRLDVVHVTITSDKLPIDFSLKILQLSDIHIGSLSGKYLEKLIRTVNEQSPELIVLTGDYFSDQRIFEKAGTPPFDAELNAISHLITSLSAPYGVWVVRGNHDFSDDKELGDLFIEKLRNQGIPLLTNQVKELRIKGQSLYLIGLDYSNFTDKQVAKFPVRVRGKEKFLRSGPSSKNSYTHYYPLNDSLWQDYEFTAKFRMTEPRTSTMGLNIYSQYHLGYDRYYRWRWYPEEQRFHFAPHGTVVVEQTIATSFALQKDTWYYAKTKIRTTPDRTVMYGKSWQTGEPEPAAWQASAYDSSTTRFHKGTVGIYSNLTGIHEFDDLCVVTLSGDTLLSENLQNVRNGFKPQRWADFNWNEQALPFLAEQAAGHSYSILLAHLPNVMDHAIAEKIDLQLSGHTHGGQIYLPLVGAPWTHAQKGRHFDRGLYYSAPTTLYVNRGIGTIFIPARFLSPPEITVLRLQETRH